MSGMVTHTCQLLDQCGNAWQRPQLGLVAMSGGAFQEGFHHLLALNWGELGLATGRPLTRKRGNASGLPSLTPTIDDLSGYPQAPGHHRGRQFLAEHSSGSPSPPFHLRMISHLRHAQIIADGTINVTLLCESQ